MANQGGRTSRLSPHAIFRLCLCQARIMRFSLVILLMNLLLCCVLGASLHLEQRGILSSLVGGITNLLGGGTPRSQQSSLPPVANERAPALQSTSAGGSSTSSAELGANSSRSRFSAPRNSTAKASAPSKSSTSKKSSSKVPSSKTVNPRVSNAKQPSSRQPNSKQLNSKFPSSKSPKSAGSKPFGSKAVSPNSSSPGAPGAQAPSNTLNPPSNPLLTSIPTPDPEFLQANHKGNYLRSVLETIPRGGREALTPRQLQALIQYTKLALLAQCTDIQPGPFTCKVFCNEFPNTTTIDRFQFGIQDYTGYIARDDARKAIIVSFKGADTIISKLFDLALIPFPYLRGRGSGLAMVHSGIMTSYYSARTFFISRVVNQLASFPDYTLEVVGHSMGGNYAVMHAIDLLDSLPDLDPKRITLVTFGEARFGNRAFANYIDRYGFLSKRVVNKRDKAPHFIKQSMGFQHHAQELWTVPGPDITTLACDGQEDPQCSDSIEDSAIDDDHLVYLGIDVNICQKL
ncbi:uncharacterized protein VTP21DRAFT_10334 [Calcarisporiella thermophila]|uniref:uncharacterized protein n=1 Tax=Calcarisporiella thermophila TaxID=911321 RepID=UPI003744AAA8